MSRIFLLRHAQSLANEKGILAGRMDSVSLSKRGLTERNELEQRFQDAAFEQIISSPMQRCLETIANIFPSPKIAAEFQEVDYGDWTGKRMRTLARKKAWQEIHKNPASVRFPNGETLPEVQTRALLGLDLHVDQRKKNILISTHADVVKVIILHALGTHLNNIDKIQISNASISVLDIKGRDLRVVKVNDTSAKLREFLV